MPEGHAAVLQAAQGSRAAGLQDARIYAQQTSLWQGSHVHDIMEVAMGVPDYTDALARLQPIDLQRRNVAATSMLLADDSVALAFRTHLKKRGLLLQNTCC